MVSTKKVCRSDQSFFFTNQSHTFMIDLQQTKSSPKYNIAARAISSDIRTLTVYTGRCPLLNVYFNDMHLRTTASEIRRVSFLASFFCFFA